MLNSQSHAISVVVILFNICFLLPLRSSSFLPSPWQGSEKHQTRFVTQKPAKVVLTSMEVVAQSMGFKTHIRNFKVDVSAFSIIELLLYYSAL